MFDRVAVPTPFQVGPVNAYLAGRTVVDPGPDSVDAREALAAGLAERDLALADVERVLVTHPHPDHFGLADRLRDDGADVLASPAAAAILRDFEGRLDYEQAYFCALFAAHGMGEETARTVTQLPEAFLEFAPSTGVDRELGDGEAVAVADREVGVRALAGHAPGEVALAFGTGGHRAAIVGDHVLGRETPNPFLQPPADGWDPDADRSAAQLRETIPDFDARPPAGLDDARPRVLPAYNDSLERVRAVGYDRLLPGHGDAIDDPAGRIDEILAAHEDRSEDVREAVAAGDGPTTATEVMHALFPDLAVIDYFPGMSEAIGHLDVLVDRDVVERRESDGRLAYELA